MKKQLFFGLLILSYLSLQSVIAQVKVGDEAPDFSYTDTEGNMFTLSDHKGKVVFMFLFGNTCPSCLAIGNKTETEINQVFSSEDDFIAVGLDMWNNSSSNASVKSFKSQTGITFPLLVKAGGLASLYGTSYDRLIVIDKEGIIRHKTNLLVSSDLNAAKSVVSEFLMSAAIDRNYISSENQVLYGFPNPVSNELNIHLKLKRDYSAKVNVYNSLGKMVKSIGNFHFSSGEEKLMIDMSEIKNGIYFYTIDLEGDKKMSGKFIVRK